jgi:hypothetical protein
MVVGSWEAFQAITLAWLARSLAEVGDFKESIATGLRAVTLAEELGSPYSLAAAFIGLGYGHLVKGDVDAAGPLSNGLSRRRRGEPRAVSSAGHSAARRSVSIGRTADRGGRRPGARRRGRGGVETAADAACQSSSHCSARRVFFAGRPDEASIAAQRALALAQERGQRGDVAAALYVLGEAGARGSIRPS